MNKYILERLRNEHQKRLESKQKCKHILRQTHIISRIYSFIEPTFLISLMNISREWKSTCDDIQKYKEWFQNELSERLSGKKDDEKSSFTVSIHDLPIAFFKLAVDKESTFMLNKRPRVAHTFVEPKHIVTCWRLLLDDLPISNFSILGRVRNHHVITILCHGGSFAGCVMDGDGNVVAHKTFKRYVTRKKQGKRQSNKDKSGHRPRSMGSQIRRKEETLFNNEVQKLIKEWKYYIDDASLIFLHAPGHNRFLICFEDGPLDKNDTRIRNIPFPTHTPTLKGAKEAYNKLTSITISFGNNHLNEEEELQVNEEDVNIL